MLFYYLFTFGTQEIIFIKMLLNVNVNYRLLMLEIQLSASWPLFQVEWTYSLHFVCFHIFF
jgi:hypothetical protein